MDESKMENPARAAMKVILKSKGCTLEDNDDITSDASGQVVAFFKGATFTKDGIDFNIQLLKALEYITVDVTIGKPEPD